MNFSSYLLSNHLSTDCEPLRLLTAYHSMRVKKQKTILRARACSFAFACVVMSSAGLSQTETPVLRDWNEVMLNAIRNDLARPNVHARNLYHFTEGIYHLQLRTEGAATEAIDSEVAVWPEDNEALLTIQNDEINFEHRLPHPSRTSNKRRARKIRTMNRFTNKPNISMADDTDHMSVYTSSVKYPTGHFWTH